jgi:hypothetical protein
MVTTPESRFSSPAIDRSNVDFPDPEGPSSAVSSPEGISRLTSSRAANEP